MKRAFKNLCLKLVSEPYIWGAENPALGFDCSGFACFVLQIFGVLSETRKSAQQLCDSFQSFGTVPITDATLGDLVFYAPDGTAVHHVMVALGDGLCVGADGGDQTTTTIEEAHRRGAAVHVRHITYRHDFFCVRPVAKVLDAIEESDVQLWLFANGLHTVKDGVEKAPPDAK